VEYEDIISGTGRLNKNVYAKRSEKSGIEFHQGDVLYGKLRPYLQNWLLPLFSGLAVGDFWVLQPQNTDSGFLYRLIQSRQFDEVANQSTGTKMPRADWKLVAKTEFSIPKTIQEQAAIGTYFRNLDNLITLQQRKLDGLQKFKKAMLQKMFPKAGSSQPEIRFQGFTGDWEQRKLSEIATEVNRNDPESNAPIMMITANNGFIEQSERYAFNNAGESLKKYILLKKSELAYNHGASKLRPYGSCFALTTSENARIPLMSAQK
jgi:type I restriction enzyme S subunit